MKGKLISIIIMAAITSAAFFIGLEAGEKGNFYAKTAIVTEVDYENDVVTVVDRNGEEWCFYGCEDWQIDDVCSMLMDTAGTESIYDDIIISAVSESN